ncbi:MAG: FecR domain-containing protein [Woeseia sp.]
MKQQTDLRSEQALEELLSQAEPRPLPPQQDEKLIRRAVHAEWDKLTKRRVRNRRLTSFALAASVLVAVLIGLNVLRGPFDAGEFQQIASIQKQFGIVKVWSKEQAGADGTEMSEIGSGHVETGQRSGLTLGWNDGGSLRLDENTRVEFESMSAIYLQYGRIYFDSMPKGIPSVITDPDRGRLAIRTDTGTVQHYGTQFITQVRGDELSVLVREGRVSIEGNRVKETATVGQKLTVTGDGQTLIDVVGVTGGDWAWIEKTSPAFVLDNRPIIEFLTWVSRESGKRLDFASPGVEKVAREKELRGITGVTEMEPSRALDIYMPTTGLRWRTENGVIVVDDGDPNNRSGGT